MGFMPKYYPYGSNNPEYAEKMSKINWQYEGHLGGLLDGAVGPFGIILDVVRFGIDVMDKVTDKKSDQNK